MIDSTMTIVLWDKTLNHYKLNTSSDLKEHYLVKLLHIFIFCGILYPIQNIIVLHILSAIVHYFTTTQPHLIFLHILSSLSSSSHFVPTGSHTPHISSYIPIVLSSAPQSPILSTLHFPLHSITFLNLFFVHSTYAHRCCCLE